MFDPLRPTFERAVAGLDPEALAERLAEVLNDPERGFPHRRAGRHFMVWIPDGRRRTWSPWLHVDVVEAAPTGGVVDVVEARTTGAESADGAHTATLFGRFTPAPSLWTGVALSYLALGTLAVGGGLFGYCQWLVDERPTGLWLVLGASLAAAALLVTARAGQALAHAEMTELREVLERAFEAPAHAPATGLGAAP